MGIQQLKPKLEQGQNERAVIGGNRPPVAIEARAEFDDLINQNEGLLKKIDDLSGASERATCTSEETFSRCSMTVNQIRQATKLVEAAHVSAKAPYLEGGRVVDAAKNELCSMLTAARSAIEAKQQAYLREQKRRDDERRAKIEAEERRVQEENLRIQREHAEAVRKAAAEAEQAIRESELQGKPIAEFIAPEPVPEPIYIAPPTQPREIERGMIRNTDGTTASSKLVWKSEVQDYAKAFITVQSNPKVKEAIDAAIASVVKAGMHQIEGVRTWQDVAVNNR